MTSLVLSLPACTVYEKVSSTVSSKVNGIIGKSSDKTVVSGGDAVKVDTVAATPAADNDKRTALAEDIAKSADSARERVLPPVRVQPQPVVILPGVATPDSASIVESKITPLSPLARILGGNWTIVQVGSTIIDRDEDMPYIVFVPGDGSFYANNGCNTLNGSYTVEGDNICFHNVLTTLRYCADVDFDHQINAIVADEVVSGLKVSEVGNESILEFVTPAGKTLMRLRRGNLEFLNGQWNITAVDGLEALSTPATVFFDLNDMKLHGNTGCNFINGEIYLDHRMANAVDFSNIITTLRACEYPSQQTAILVALEETASAISDGSDKVILLNHDGKILLELSKAADNQ